MLGPHGDGAVGHPAPVRPVGVVDPQGAVLEARGRAVASDAEPHRRAPRRRRRALLLGCGPRHLHEQMERLAVERRRYVRRGAGAGGNDAGQAEQRERRERERARGAGRADAARVARREQPGEPAGHATEQAEGDDDVARRALALIPAVPARPAFGDEARGDAGDDGGEQRDGRGAGPGEGTHGGAASRCRPPCRPARARGAA
jgi:hypothetical protein